MYIFLYIYISVYICLCECILLYIKCKILPHTELYNVYTCKCCCFVTMPCFFPAKINLYVFKYVIYFLGVAPRLRHDSWICKKLLEIPSSFPEPFFDFSETCISSSLKNIIGTENNTQIPISFHKYSFLSF